jgi:Ran GTPase-activating protein (RanGAP) involved in mRNA processing and transport
LTEKKLALADALKQNSTLKSLTVIADIDDERREDSASLSSVFADALKVNSSLTCLNLCRNAIQQEGARAFAAALEVNSSLTYLNLNGNLIQQEGVLAITDALQENITLTSLVHSGNDIQFHGLSSIAEALTYNPTLFHLDISDSFENRFSGLQEFFDTFHSLESVLKPLIGEDGAQVLGTTFCIKFRCVTLE